MLNYDLHKGTLTVTLTGDIDHASAPGMRVFMDNLIKKECSLYNRFVLDLSGITFMDSTAVGLIMGRYKLLKSLGKAVHFSEPSAVADKVLKVSGLYTIINRLD